MVYFILIILLLSTLAIAESIDVQLIPPGAGIVVFFILFLFAAFRPIGLDNDSGTYTVLFNIFERPEDYFLHWSTWGYFEPLYYLIPSTLKYTFQVEDFVRVTFCIYAFLGCGITMFVLRRLTNYYYASILTLFCNYYLLHNMTQIRTAVAVGFFLLCLQLRMERRWLGFVICIFVSGLFHYSSVLAIALLFFTSHSINKTLYTFLALASLALSFIDFSWLLQFGNFNAGAFEQKQEAYLTNIQNELLNRRNYIFLIHLATSLILLYHAGRLYSYNKYVYLVIKTQIVGLLFFQVLSASPAISERVADYYWAVHFITLPISIQLFRFKMWPAVALCVLNTVIFLTLIYRNHILHIELLSSL